MQTASPAPASFHDEVFREFEPTGPIELALAETLIGHWTRLRDLRALESSFLDAGLESALFGPNAKKFDRLARCIAAGERAFQRATRELRAAQQSRRRAALDAARRAESEARAQAKLASAEYERAFREYVFAPPPGRAAAAPPPTSYSTPPRASRTSAYPATAPCAAVRDAAPPPA